jgi:hypothetical protein
MVTRFIPLAGLVLFVRLTAVVTARLALRGGLAIADLMQGHSRSDRTDEGEGEHGQYKISHGTPP